MITRKNEATESLSSFVSNTAYNPHLLHLAAPQGLPIVREALLATLYTMDISQGFQKVTRQVL